MGPTTCANQPQHLVASGVRTCVCVHYFLCPFVCLLVYPVQAVVIFYSYYCPKPPLYLSIHIYTRACVCLPQQRQQHLYLLYTLFRNFLFHHPPISLISLFLVYVMCNSDWRCCNFKYNESKVKK